MLKPLIANAPLACLPHDHSHCVSGALAQAQSLCELRRVRLDSLALAGLGAGVGKPQAAWRL